MSERDEIRFWHDIGSKQWFAEYKEFLVNLGMLVAMVVIVYLAAMIFVAFNSVFVSGWEELEGRTASFRNIVLVIAGPVGFIFAFWRLKHSDEQVVMARKDGQRKDAERVEALFQGAAGMFCGADQKLVSLGLVQLEKTARSHPEEYLQTTISLICAAARDLGKKEEIEHTSQVHGERIKEMIRVATLLAQFSEFFSDKPAKLDIRGLNLSCFVFENITLTGEHMQGCTFIDATFRNCKIIGHFYGDQFGRNPSIPPAPNGFPEDFFSAFFDKCDFSDANIYHTDFRESDFFNCTIAAECFNQCDFRKTAFCKSMLITRGIKAIFLRCHFSPQHIVGSLDASLYVTEHENVFSNEPNGHMCFNSKFIEKPMMPNNNFLPEHFSVCSVVKGTLKYIGLEVVAPNLKCDVEKTSGDREFFRVSTIDRGR